MSGGQSTAVQSPSSPSIPKCKEYNSVACTINMVDAQLAVTQRPKKEDLTQGKPARHSLSSTNFQGTNTSSQVFKILPHVSDKFNQLIVPLPFQTNNSNWCDYLEHKFPGYPDLNRVNYLLSGFKQGFRLGHMKVWISSS